MKRFKLEGQTFGYLRVLSRSTDDARKWLCLCTQCNSTKIALGYGLVHGQTISCGCVKSPSKRLIDLTGKTFGKWTVLSRSERREIYRVYFYNCRCACGTVKQVRSSGLTDGSSQSCGGCLNLMAPGTSGFKTLIGRYRNRAKKCQLDWSLTSAECGNLFSLDCHYCGVPPNQLCNARTGIGMFVYNGLDRVDNSCGYSMDNVVPCCKVCNAAKSAMTLDEFKAWVLRVAGKFTEKTAHAVAG